MSIVNTLALESNRQIKINFDGGDLSSDAGLLLIKEFISKLGIDTLLEKAFKTNDSALFRYHSDPKNLLQMIYMIIAGYFEDDASDELTNDPVFKSVLEKDALASQPTVSRFFNRMDEDTLNQFLAIARVLRREIYSIQMPQAVILDLDSTLLDAYGRQEGRAFNFHYQSNGYHPLVCYDGMTGDLIKIQLRDGTQYSCTGVVDFLQPVLDEYLHDYPEIPILLRGDSGFSTPDLYKQCEENGTSYVIRLKENGILRGKASDLVDELDEITRNNKVDYAVVYGEFMYKAKSWPYERRVVCKVEKPENQMVYMYTFIVTNMDSSPEYLIKFYCKRGLMENFIKEKSTQVWIETRRSGKLTRKDETDTIQKLVEYAKEQGSQHADKLYMTYSKLANKMAGISKRDEASVMQLNNLSMMEHIILCVIDSGIISEKHYKEIYQDCKKRLELVKNLAYLEQKAG